MALQGPQALPTIPYSIVHPTCLPKPVPFSVFKVDHVVHSQTPCSVVKFYLPLVWMEIKWKHSPCCQPGMELPIDVDTARFPDTVILHYQTAHRTVQRYPRELSKATLAPRSHRPAQRSVKSGTVNTTTFLPVPQWAHIHSWGPNLPAIVNIVNFTQQT